jgi:DNA-binding Lrp family transcriptional regulator
MKQSALVFLKIDEKKDFVSAFKKLHAMENVVSCEATKGDLDIFMKIEDDSADKCSEFFNSRIKSLDEVKSSYYLPVKETVASGVTKDDQTAPMVQSIILAEMDEEKIGPLLNEITGGGMISSYDKVKGDFNFVLTVEGRQFIQIDKFISNKLFNLDGVVKLKEYPIINIYGN